MGHIAPLLVVLLLDLCAGGTASEFKMQKVLVTGGSGYLGGHLIRQLLKQGVHVHAIGRSEAALAAVKQAGAVPFKAHIGDVESMAEAASGCDTLFHSAGLTNLRQPDSMTSVNVRGVENAMRAARRAGVKRAIYIGSTAACYDASGNPLRGLNEQIALPASPAWAAYAASKNAGEKAALRHNGEDGLEVVVVRPPVIWGKDDPLVLPELAKRALSGEQAWADHGEYNISVCHIDNAVEGTILAARRGVAGAAYFLTDGEPVLFRSFITRMLASVGLEPPSLSMPLWALWGVATAAEGLCGVLGCTPMAQRQELMVLAQEATVSDAKARRELGYTGRATLEQGMAEMAAWQGELVRGIKRAKEEV